MGFISQHSELNLKTLRQIHREGIDVVKYAEAVTPWHRQDAWKPEWRMERFKCGARGGTASTQFREPAGSEASSDALPPPVDVNQGTLHGIDGEAFSVLDEKDIMIGRGGSFLLNHIGNHYFQEILEQNLEPFKLAQTENARVKVVDSVMNALGEGGFRVLGVNDDGLNVILSRRSLRRKVG